MKHALIAGCLSPLVPIAIVLWAIGFSFELLSSAFLHGRHSANVYFEKAEWRTDL